MCDSLTYGLKGPLLATRMVTNFSGRPYRSVRIYPHSQRHFGLFQFYKLLEEACYC